MRKKNNLLRGLAQDRYGQAQKEVRENGRYKARARLPVYLAAVVLGLLLGLGTGRTKVYADVWTNAQSFYENYGNETVFHADSETDGRIYFGTSASRSSSPIRYATIGWKVLIRDSDGNLLQELYYELGGNHMEDVSTEVDGELIYRLYAIRLSSLKERMDSPTREAFDSGNCRMTLDACMTIVRNDIPDGSMDDSGNFTGTVYTSYEGISAAIEWSEKTKESMRRSFGKTVNGLFFTILLSAGDGIASVEGGGSYCYGTLAEISAVCLPDHRFRDWTGTKTINEQTASFYVNANLSLQARAKANQPPQISAENRYYSLSDAQAGRITAEELLGHFSATDQDGAALSWPDLRFENYDADSFLQAEGEQEISLILIAEDGNGLISRKEVKIHLVDTRIRKNTELTGRIRFISAEYFEDEAGQPICQKMGGLLEDSIWTTRSDYRDLLRYVLAE